MQSFAIVVLIFYYVLLIEFGRYECGTYTFLVWRYYWAYGFITSNDCEAWLLHCGFL